MVSIFGTIEPPLDSNQSNEEWKGEVDEAKSEEYGLDLLYIGFRDIMKISKKGELAVFVGYNLN